MLAPMPDEPDPPRKIYQLKPKEFERVNVRPAGEAADAGPPIADPGPGAGAIPPTARIDVRDLARQAAGTAPLLGVNQPANRPNEVHAVLQEEYRRAQAAGLFHVTPADDKQRRRRIRNYWIAIIAWNVPFGAIAWSANPTKEMGPASAIVFVCALAAMTMFTSYLTWQNFFLRTER
jgi:hypothetical protein